VARPVAEQLNLPGVISGAGRTSSAAYLERCWNRNWRRGESAESVAVALVETRNFGDVRRPDSMLPTMDLPLLRARLRI